jgi:hypothetical protein
MKKTLKTLGLAVAVVAGIFAFTGFALDAWDNTMTDAEVIQYLNDYPDEVKLQKLAEKRGLINNDEIVNGKWIAGAPEFVYYDGHCDIDNPEYQRETEILDFAMQLYDGSIEGTDFEDCYEIAKAMYQ